MNPAAAAALRLPLAPLVGGPPVWLVGGGLRDALLGRPVADLDLAIAGDARAAAAQLARAHGADRFALSRDFGSWRVSGGRLPFHVDITPLQGPDITADLLRRDLTINAIALPLVAAEGREQPVDPSGGLTDLAAGRLSLVGPEALRQDPVRLLRIARFAAQLDFTIAPDTSAQARVDAGRLWGAPGERLAEELGRMVCLARADRAIRVLDELGILGVLAPALDDCRGVDQSEYHHLDVLGHTLEVVEHAVELAADPEPYFRADAARVSAVLSRPIADGLSGRELLILSALFHDMAKAQTRTVYPGGHIGFPHHDVLGAEMVGALMERLRCANRLREQVGLSIRRHLALGFLVHRTPLSLRQVDRYLRATAPAEVEIILLTCADRLATNGPRTSESAIRRHLVLAREVMATHFSLVDRGPIVPLLRGDTLAARLGRPPGPWLSALLDHLREEQLTGHVTTVAQAQRAAERWNEQHPA